MSTSRNRSTPIEFMSANTSNVLWELKPRGQSDAAFHHGADVSSLSQFAAEEEVLFPPCTMLIVQRDNIAKSPKESSPAAEPTHSKPPNDAFSNDTAPQLVTEQERSFFAISALPCFV